MKVCLSKKLIQAPTRDTYRHGDLRRASLNAGIEPTRETGSDAIGLREATRRAGVAPYTAYRHFASRQDLLMAVRASPLSALAIATETETAALNEEPALVDFARGCLPAVGFGFLSVSRAQPGLLHIAFSWPLEVGADSVPERAGCSGLDPSLLLGATLDRLIEARILATERRQGAEYLAWSAAHGLALLFTEGSLRSSTYVERMNLGKQAVETAKRVVRAVSSVTDLSFPKQPVASNFAFVITIKSERQWSPALSCL